MVIVGVSARADVTHVRRTGSNPRRRTLEPATRPLTKLRRVDVTKVASREKVAELTKRAAFYTLPALAGLRQDGNAVCESAISSLGFWQVSPCAFCDAHCARICVVGALS